MGGIAVAGYQLGKHLKKRRDASQSREDEFQELRQSYQNLAPQPSDQAQTSMTSRGMLWQDNKPLKIRYKRHQNQVRTHSKTQVDNVVVNDRKETQTRFVRVPVTNKEGEAYREAIRRVVELNPKLEFFASQIQSTMEQLLHGANVKERTSE
jgi:hypothetical protein